MTDAFDASIAGLPDTSLETDEQALVRLGYDPATHYIQHCAHCDRDRPNPHWSCVILPLPQPESERKPEWRT